MELTRLLGLLQNIDVADMLDHGKLTLVFEYGLKKIEM